MHDEPLKNLRINFNQNQLSAFECRKGKYLRKITAEKFVRFSDCMKCVCGLIQIPHEKKIENNMLKVYQHTVRHSREIRVREKSMKSDMILRNF